MCGRWFPDHSGPVWKGPEAHCCQWAFVCLSLFFCLVQGLHLGILEMIVESAIFPIYSLLELQGPVLLVVMRMRSLVLFSWIS